MDSENAGSNPASRMIGPNFDRGSSKGRTEDFESSNAGSTPAPRIFLSALGGMPSPYEVRFFHTPNSTDPEVVRVNADSDKEALLLSLKKLDASDIVRKVLVEARSEASVGGVQGVVVDRSAVIDALRALKAWDRLRRGAATHLQEQAEEELHNSLGWVVRFLQTSEDPGPGTVVLDRVRLGNLKSVLADWWRVVRGGFNAKKIEVLESDLLMAAESALEGDMKRMASEKQLRSEMIRLAYANPELRSDILPLLSLRTAADPSPSFLEDLKKSGVKLSPVKGRPLWTSKKVIEMDVVDALEKSGWTVDKSIRGTDGYPDIYKLSKSGEKVEVSTGDSGVGVRVSVPRTASEKTAGVGAKELKALSKAFTGEVGEEDVRHLNYWLEESEDGTLTSIRMEDRDGHLGHMEATVEAREAKSYGTSLESLSKALKAGGARLKSAKTAGEFSDAFAKTVAKNFKRTTKGGGPVNLSTVRNQLAIHWGTSEKPFENHIRAVYSPGKSVWTVKESQGILKATKKTLSDAEMVALVEKGFQESGSGKTAEYAEWFNDQSVYQVRDLKGELVIWQVQKGSHSQKLKQPKLLGEYPTQSAAKDALKDLQGS